MNDNGTSMNNLPYDIDGFNDFDMTMGNFLSNVMNPMPTTTFDANDMLLPDVLDFTFDDFMEFPLSSLDRNPSPYHRPQATIAPNNRQSLHASGTQTPNVRKAADIGLQAFRESMWLW